MIDPFDTALSQFIDSLPEDHESAQALLHANAPFSGHGDLPALAELATLLRSVPPPRPNPQWAMAAKARIMAAPVLPPEKRGFTWLGSMFLPLTQLSLPSISLPRLSMPSPVFARAAMAAVLVAALASVAHNRAGTSPIPGVPAGQAPIDSAEQAIADAEAEVARLAGVPQSQVAGVEIQGTPRDVVLLSKRIDLAEEAIDKAPEAMQPKLRSQLQSAVKGVRFDGQLEAVTNGDTLQVSGVAVKADPATVQQLQVGQPISLVVAVSSKGKFEAVQVTPLQPSPAPAATPSRSAAASPPPPAQNAATASQTNPSTSDTGSGSAPASAAASPLPAPKAADRAPANHDKADAPADAKKDKGDRGDKQFALAAIVPAAPDAGGSHADNPPSGAVCGATTAGGPACHSDDLPATAPVTSVVVNGVPVTNNPAPQPAPADPPAPAGPAAPAPVSAPAAPSSPAPSPASSNGQGSNGKTSSQSVVVVSTNGKTVVSSSSTSSSTTTTSQSSQGQQTSAPVAAKVAASQSNVQIKVQSSSTTTSSSSTSGGGKGSNKK